MKIITTIISFPSILCMYFYLMWYILGASEEINLKLNTCITFNKARFDMEYQVSTLYLLKMVTILVLQI